MRYSRTVLIGSLALFLFAPSGRLTAEIITGVAAVNGTQLYYEQQGQGHPLVLIHGGILSSTEWEEQFQPFAAHYQVLRYDVRGFGKSAVREFPYSNSEDLYQLLQFLKIEKTYLVGGSSGGGLAINFTLEHPEMVAALVLVGAAIDGWQYSPEFIQRGFTILLAAVAEGAETAAELWLKDPYLIPAPENPAARQQFRTLFITDYRGFLAPWYLARPLKPPALQRLSEISIPTLIILGQLDIPDVLTMGETLGKQLPAAQTVTIPKAGHLGHMAKPEEFNQLVLDFLSQQAKP